MTRDLLLRSKPDIIINVIDATNIERSLYLSLQLIELNTPMIMALNMMDELTASGGSINIKKIEDRLTVPVVQSQPNSGAGVDELLSTRPENRIMIKKMPERLDFLFRRHSYGDSFYRPPDRSQKSAAKDCRCDFRQQNSLKAMNHW